MLHKTSFLLLLVVIGALATYDVEPENESMSPRKSRTATQNPADVARCLNGALEVGCGTFACLENSTCDTDGMYGICNSFLHSAAKFDTQGKLFVKESLKCVANGIISKAFLTIRRCSLFQKMIAEVQEECYSRLDMCTVAKHNPEAISDVLQMPALYSNRYFSNLISNILDCGDVTANAIKEALLEKIDPNTAKLLLLFQATHHSSQQGTGRRSSESEKLKIYFGNRGDGSLLSNMKRISDDTM
ncbi:stanniocalcin-1 [Protopterus annectens]|uniref:stanniocalcin-1 n=1 Tax=Protopterus annectens TaxID=7888 RepID=UPI001CF9AD62|nr:stanniocalcin-1 [Protopterus annectens]